MELDLSNALYLCLLGVFNHIIIVIICKDASFKINVSFLMYKDVKYQSRRSDGVHVCE